MSAALRAGIVLSALWLVACDSVLGLKEIVSDGAPAALAFKSVTTRGVAQQPLDLITVNVTDIQGNPVPGFSGEIKLTLGANPGGASLLGAVTATVTAGTAYFDVVGIDKLGTGYTLVASVDGLAPATSGPIDVVAPPFTPISTGFHGAPITSIAVSPAPAGGTTTVFAGAGDGVYKSVDGGASWKPANFGGSGAGRLVADPKHPGVVYLGRTNGGGVLKKTMDGGATWHGLGLGDTATLSYVYSYDIDPRDPSVIYATGFGGEGAAIRRSTDGGTSWSVVNVPYSCQQIAIDPVTSSRLYCAAYNSQTGQGVGVYKSSDSGMTWGAANTGLASLYAYNLLVTPNAVFVIAGNTLYRSIDAGTSWTSLPVSYPGTMAYAPSMPKRIYLSVSGGVSVSNDAGASFGSPVSTTDFLEGLAVDPTNPDVVYAAGGSRGVFVSTNGGVSWSPSSMGIDAPRVSSVAMAPGVPGTVLTSAGGAVLRTTNSGTTWTTIAQLDAAIRFDPTVSTRVYMCAYGYFSTSTNSGASFTGGSTSGLAGCSRVVVAGTTLFAAGGGQLFKSTNSGATWATASTTGLYINDVALGDGVGSVVVVSTGNGIYRSIDGGSTFTQVTTGYAGPIVADPRTPTHVVTAGCLLSVPTNGGATFGTPFSDACVQTLNDTGSALYAAGSNNNAIVLLRSSDGGSNWTKIETAGGIPDGLNITSISASDDAQTIYLGTSAGLYKSAGR